jgi:hypothetical protein
MKRTCIQIVLSGKDGLHFPARMAMYVMAFFLLMSCGAGKEEEKAPFIKGVYGNPGTLLHAGYNFDSLGMNAVFVRSVSLNQEFYASARAQGCKVFVEFPTLLGKDYLGHHPEAWPINELGERSPPADWFMGICPTDSAFKTHRTQQLNTILDNYQVDGIFLDYFHWHAQFETPEPILPETCFCDRCTSLFGKYIQREIPGEHIPGKAEWILEHADHQWREWRNSVLNQWAIDMGKIVHDRQPEALLGVYYCSWYPTDYDSALYRTLGIDVGALSGHANVLAPMLFHRMKGRPVEWVGEYISWLDRVTDAGAKGKPLIWPIVQAHNSPGVVTAEEFRQVMHQGSRYPVSGIMMFSDQSLIADTAKIAVMKDFYLNR